MAKKTGAVKLVQRLGEGSFAQTFKAEVTDPHLAKKWDKIVAVKVPKGPENQDAVLDDVVNMARIQGVLSCYPEAAGRLVNFFGCWRYKEYYCMVCEFVDGMDLQKWMDTRESSRVLSYVEAIDCIVQVCEGLAVLHRARIYHRDIKPSNILMSRTEDGIDVKLADFGLSIALDFGKETMSNTKTGALAYTPPENLKDYRRPLVPSYDLYGLGLVLYQVCCDALPFRRLDGIGVPAEAMDLNQPYRHPHELALEVPECLCRVIVKAVDKHPERRYQSAQEMMEDLLAAKQELDHVLSSQTPALPEITVRIDKIMKRLEGETPSMLSSATAEAVEKELLALAELHPYQPEVFICLGRFCAKWLGDPPKAIEAFQTGLKESPESPLLLYYLGVALLEQPNPTSEAREKAVGYLKRAVQNGLRQPQQVAKAKKLFKAHSRLQ